MIEEYNDVLRKLHDYMLNENNIQNSLHFKINLHKDIKEKSTKIHTLKINQSTSSILLAVASPAPGASFSRVGVLPQSCRHRLTDPT